MKAIVYGRDNPFCPYCDQAKSLLAAKNIPFDYIRVGEDITKEELLEIVPGAKSVPQIFLNEKYVGGFDNLRALLSQS